MWWQKLLKGVLPEKLFDKLADIDIEEIKIGSDNKVNSDNTTNNGTFINNGNIIITDAATAKKLLEGLNVDKLETGDTVLEADSTETLKKIDDKFWDKETQKEIDRFRGIVPKYDLTILESAIFIQTLYEDGQNVENYLRDISEKFGPRGTMICHLYSAGYYDSQIIPLYNELVETDDPHIDEFNEIYDFIVKESPLALFVSKRDSVSDVELKVLKKIKANQASEVGYLNIHGIGKQNVLNIKKALKANNISKLLVGEPTEQTKMRMTTIVIYFKV